MFSDSGAVLAVSENLAIDVRDVGKSYHIYEHPSHRLMQGLVGAKKRYYREFWALRGVNIQIRPGQTVGVVGRNGSGKSTLLQMLAGTLTPTEGSVRIQGRVAALLELGSGFNPDFTGRENVYLNASILGLSRSEVEARLDAILAFADIGEFIDQPVRNYSSGMALRLAFAVQAQVQPQVLIVDEALAVGDAKFQAKCFARLKQLKEEGTAILLVSHATDQIVQHCDHALLLDGGRAVCSGKPRDVVNRYLDLLFGKDKPDAVAERQPPLVGAVQVGRFSGGDSGFEGRPNYNPHEYRWGDGAARIVDFELCSDTMHYPVTLKSGERIRLTLRIVFERQVVRPILGFFVKTKEGVVVYASNTEYKPMPEFAALGEEGSVTEVTLAYDCRLADGDYFISVGVASRNEAEVVPHDRRFDSIHFQVMGADFFGMADLSLEMTM
ncbi:ABC transporter ATP-binding protein [Luteimonas sp. 100069]|uniref:ABC transporter ATP-binding protein n=1 Tax=Luteimonas sp. 100069 TaxID=2006109 RepID=UPI000F4EF2E9|nr:ABC transporter ATP-binding protein [Luteimonas sp. 100069]RPD87775.1 ABC transporter ATP-binding protein [Luteimonas sp. 100069]